MKPYSWGLNPPTEEAPGLRLHQEQTPQEGGRRGGARAPPPSGADTAGRRPSESQDASPRQEAVRLTLTSQPPERNFSLPVSVVAAQADGAPCDSVLPQPDTHPGQMKPALETSP